TQVKKIATLAEAYHVPLAPHCTASALGIAASLHVAAAEPFLLIHEFYPDNAGFNPGGFLHLPGQLDAAGQTARPPRPGRGWGGGGDGAWRWRRRRRSRRRGSRRRTAGRGPSCATAPSRTTDAVSRAAFPKVGPPPAPGGARIHPHEQSPWNEVRRPPPRARG